MILKASDTSKCNITMYLDIDYETKEIEIHIRHHDKLNRTICGYNYSASEFSTALAKFEELETSTRRKN